MSIPISDQYILLEINTLSCRSCIRHSINPQLFLMKTLDHSNITRHLSSIKDKGYVLDRRSCEKNKEYGMWSGLGPMVNPLLPPKSKRSVQELKSVHNSNSCNALDFVSLDVYLDFWRERGARIGKRNDRFIEWEDREVQFLRS